MREPLGGTAFGAGGGDDAALCGGSGGGGGQHGLSPMLASPPAQAALDALDALAAAAGYAGKHGTPAIQAALAQAPEAAAAFATAVAAMHSSGGGSTPPGASAAAAAVAARRTASPAICTAHPFGLPAQDPSPKRQRTSEPPASTPPPAAVWPSGPAFGSSGGKDLSGAAAEWSNLPFQQQQQHAGAAAVASWQPSTGQAQLFGTVLAALEAAHAPFTAEERGVVLAFRARCIVLEACAREVALISLRDFHADRAAALALMRSVLEAGGPSPAAAAGGGGSGGSSLLPSLHGVPGGDSSDAGAVPCLAGGALQEGGLTLPPGKRAQPEAWQGDKAACGTDEEEGHLAAMLLGGEGPPQEHSSGLLSML